MGRSRMSERPIKVIFMTRVRWCADVAFFRAFGLYSLVVFSTAGCGGTAMPDPKVEQQQQAEADAVMKKLYGGAADSKPAAGAEGQ
jgi:hypothetical protein